MTELGQKCNGCKYKGEHQEMGFRPFGVCLRETNLIKAQENYNALTCPYTMKELYEKAKKGAKIWRQK